MFFALYRGHWPLHVCLSDCRGFQPRTTQPPGLSHCAMRAQGLPWGDSLPGSSPAGLPPPLPRHSPALALPRFGLSPQGLLHVDLTPLALPAVIRALSTRPLMIQAAGISQLLPAHTVQQLRRGASVYSAVRTSNLATNFILFADTTDCLKSYCVQ